MSVSQEVPRSLRWWSVITFVLFPCIAVLAQDPLPSWNDTAPKQAIIAFVDKVTDVDSVDFVPPTERIAVFDNDGTLWCEQPAYVQLLFTFDRIKSLAAEHPEWRELEPYASVLKGDFHQALSGGMKGLMELLAVTHAGMTAQEFEQSVRDWIATARNPKTGKLHTDMVYQPMLELLAYLRANEFKTFIVSGGGIEFMRPWTEKVYGIPKEQVIGSTGGLKYELRDGKPVIVKQPEIVLMDDGEGKPVGIQRHIGREPIMAFGNSDGDFQMLQWTTSAPGARFGLIVHHDDADREFAYDRDSHVGKLARGLDEGPGLGWTIVSMKHDWKEVFGVSENGDSKPTGQSIVGDWLCEDIEGRGVIDNAQSTVAIDADGGFSGNSSVNILRGKATIDGDRISFGPIAMTRRAGPAALMDQEAKYTQALSKVATFRIDPNGLMFMQDSDGKTLLRFVRRNQ